MDDDRLASSPKSSRCKLPKQSSSAVLLGLLLSSIVLRTPEIASHASMSNMWMLIDGPLATLTSATPATPGTPGTTANFSPSVSISLYK